VILTRNIFIFRPLWSYLEIFSSFDHYFLTWNILIIHVHCELTNILGPLWSYLEIFSFLDHCDLTLKYPRPWPTVILPWNILILCQLWSYLEISSSLARCDLTLKYPPPWPTVILPWNILVLGPLWSYLEISSSLAHCAEMIRLSSVSGWTKPLYAAPHISWTKKELSLESILNFENTMTFRFSKYTILGY